MVIDVLAGHEPERLFASATAPGPAAGQQQPPPPLSGGVLRRWVLGGLLVMLGPLRAPEGRDQAGDQGDEEDLPDHRFHHRDCLPPLVAAVKSP